MNRGPEFDGSPLQSINPEHLALELDIDTRLLDMWNLLLGVENWDLETIGAFMRAAYSKGYADAIKEPVKGQLMIDHSFQIPSIEPHDFPND